MIQFINAGEYRPALLYDDICRLVELFPVGRIPQPSVQPSVQPSLQHNFRSPMQPLVSTGPVELSQIPGPSGLQQKVTEQSPQQLFIKGRVIFITGNSEKIILITWPYK